MKKQFALPAVCLVLMLHACTNSSPVATTSTVENPDSAWTLLPFTKTDSVNPVLAAGRGIFTCPVLHKPVKWEEKDVFNPAIVVRGDTLLMLYRAEDSIGRYAGTSRIGLAKSTDGLHFTRMPAPVFYPGNDAQKNMSGKAVAKIRG